MEDSRMKSVSPWRNAVCDAPSSRKAFIEMSSSKDYIEAHRYREKGLVDSVLLAGTTTLKA